MRARRLAACGLRRRAPTGLPPAGKLARPGLIGGSVAPILRALFGPPAKGGPVA